MADHYEPRYAAVWSRTNPGTSADSCAAFGSTAGSSNPVSSTTVAVSFDVNGYFAATFY